MLDKDWTEGSLLILGDVKKDEIKVTGDSEVLGCIDVVF